MTLAIWTDFRGVLTVPLSEGLARYCQDKPFTSRQLGTCLAALANRHGCPDGMAVLDSGVLTEREWLDEISGLLSQQFGITGSFSGMAEEWWSDRRLNHQWLQFLQERRQAGDFVAVMSNLPPEWRGRFEEFLPWHDLFDAVIVSCEVGARKPESDIFREAERVSRVPGRSSVLVDDITANVQGARDAGWNAVVGGGDATDASIAYIEELVSLRSGLQEGQHS
ncbi:hypothetical protein D4740_02225 [Actinomyces sp. 2119]|uniref:HAD-IA family hydrolase n=1 Tax=Actinomyces sp. 2119 TaxID=2321393 RepID=UPI000E6BDF99|nr:HAD-IA family hydrolase [Actinomyces sp. 2119]RJF43810.1 hypothetical protein D4740_02225 [Actinomyces sp. 2119]